VIIVFHGGGWLIHEKESMSAVSEYLSTNGEYVVVNVNCRKLGDLGNTVKMNEIIEDAMGAVLWVKTNASRFNGDSKRVILTGDSAGAHMIASVLLMKNRLGTHGFDGTHFEYLPSFLPPGKTVEQVKKEGVLDVQAAAFSYGIFDLYDGPMHRFETYLNPFWIMAGLKPRGLFGDSINRKQHPEYYRAVSPLHQVQQWKGKDLPPLFFAVGSLDVLTTPKSVEEFVGLLRSTGHREVEYWIHRGRTHAYLDAKPNVLLGNEFKEDGVPALERMLKFLNRVAPIRMTSYP
jgi:acetyl esterase/lipase